MRPPTEPGVRVDVDLRFSVDLPGERTVTGVLTGAGSALELRVSDPHVFAGRSDSRSVIGKLLPGGRSTSDRRSGDLHLEVERLPIGDRRTSTWRSADF